MILALILAALSFEASYTDASGASCYGFHMGRHEFDACHAALDQNGER